MIDVSGLKLSLDAGLPDGQTLALREIARQLGVKPGAVEGAQLLKRSVDARKKANVHFTASYRLGLSSDREEHLLARAERNDAKLKGLQIRPAAPYAPLEIPRLTASDLPPVVVGAGPAGLFAAWYLAKSGLKPLLVEQGAPVEERARDVEIFFQTGELNPWSNIQFGEGGAGTFSDGKLTTNLKNRYTAHVLHWFVDAGAPESILWQAHPHLGSDNLAHIVSTVREDIIRLGGEVRFHTKLVETMFEGGQLTSIMLRNTQTGEETLQPCTAFVMRASLWSKSPSRWECASSILKRSSMRRSGEARQHTRRSARPNTSWPFIFRADAACIASACALVEKWLPQLARRVASLPTA